MKKAILIYAQCREPHAFGDYIFAGNVARDLVRALSNAQSVIEVFLITAEDRLDVFHSLFPSPESGKVLVNGTLINLTSLTQFDAVEYSTEGFVFAAPCKLADVEEFNRLISPETRLVYLGNALSTVKSQEHVHHILFHTYYDVIAMNFNEPILPLSAGFGPGRIGFSSRVDLESLPALSSEHQALIPKEAYGFIYLGKADNCVAWVQQYIELTKLSHYIWVGERGTHYLEQIRSEWMIKNPGVAMPTIQVLSSVPNFVQRQLRHKASSVLMLSSGLESILEMFLDKQLPFYQDFGTNNQQFVLGYLEALRVLLSTEVNAPLLLDFAQLLFAPKPLLADNLTQFKDLFQRQEVRNGLVNANRRLLDQSTGRLAPQLLSFMQGTRQMKAAEQFHQLSHILANTEDCAKTPSPALVLNSVAYWGLLFQLKVVLKAHPEVLNAQDSEGLTALHWAVVGNRVDSVRALIKAQCDLSLRDKKGRTALDHAISLGYAEIAQNLRDAKTVESDMSEDDKSTIYMTI